MNSCVNNTSTTITNLCFMKTPIMTTDSNGHEHNIHQCPVQFREQRSTFMSRTPLNTPSSPRVSLSNEVKLPSPKSLLRISWVINGSPSNKNSSIQYSG